MGETRHPRNDWSKRRRGVCGHCRGQHSLLRQRRRVACDRNLSPDWPVDRSKLPCWHGLSRRLRGGALLRRGSARPESAHEARSSRRRRCPCVEPCRRCNDVEQRARASLVSSRARHHCDAMCLGGQQTLHHAHHEGCRVNDGTRRCRVQPEVLAFSPP